MLNSRFYFLFLTIAITLFAACGKTEKLEKKQLTNLSTVAGFNREFGEPFGIAFDKNNVLYVSDGEKNSIFKIEAGGKAQLVSDKLNTPSQIAFDAENKLVIADTGSRTIKKLDVQSGAISIVAGIENKSGFADGDAKAALFNAPIGIAVAENKIYVADTYNDKIRLIENGNVSTIAGGKRGFRDGFETESSFDTPTGLAVWKNGEIIVADAKNARLRVIENGNVWTLAGNGNRNLKDGILYESEMIQPMAIAVAQDNSLFVADGNSIRKISGDDLSQIATITNPKRGFADGTANEAKTNRPSSLAFDKDGKLFVADSDNQAVRVLTADANAPQISNEQIAKIRLTAEEFRKIQTPRWTYDPPEAKREIAGTLGEIRGEISPEKQAWFHNGLDIAGAYGETARFIRTEKVLEPIAAEGFGGLRERLRMPTVGYIHIRLGRDKENQIFNDSRFQFSKTAEMNFDVRAEEEGAAADSRSGIFDVRIPRGAKFEAGEAVGTLNSFNHVHLIAGRVGSEMNALDALILPDLKDSIQPIIEKVSLADENWQLLETKDAAQRIKLSGKTRIIVRAFDQMDGGATRRKLGVYKLGYQILNNAPNASSEINWTIVFDKMPDEDFVKFVYASGSKSGYTPETVFDYVVTNRVEGEMAEEKFIEAKDLPSGENTIRVWAGDFFGNKSFRDVKIAVEK